MKKFSVPCDFEGVKSPFTIYVGSARPDHHPLHFQADWLSKERGGTIPQEVMESLSKLQDLARKNHANFEDLCVYALGAAQEDDDEDMPSEPDENLDDESEYTSIDEEISEKPEEDEATDEDSEEDIEEDTEKSLEEELKELEEDTNNTKNKDTEK